MIQGPARLYCALFWIQGKTARASEYDALALYCALFWIQGKTVHRMERNFTTLYCALFWIQGKTYIKGGPGNPDCTVPYFGFKAKHCSLFYFLSSIVLCLILDSRQNCARYRGATI